MKNKLRLIIILLLSDLSLTLINNSKFIQCKIHISESIILILITWFPRVM